MEAVTSLFGLVSAPPVEIKIVLAEETRRKQVSSKRTTSASTALAAARLSQQPNTLVAKDLQKLPTFPLYFDGEAVCGKVQIRVKDGKRLEHSGVKVEFVGQIELTADRGAHHEFLSLKQELATAGELKHTVSYDFEFKNVEKQFESYHGLNMKLRYLVRVTIGRRLSDITQEKEMWVYSYKIPPEVNDSIRMEVGIEDCLHIEFEYSKSKYSMDDVIVGKIYFLLVRIKVKWMELSIVRRETANIAPTPYNENETVAKFEIMDGAPIRGETIPIRLFLRGIDDITPTFRDVNKKFSVRYYLNLVLIDEENRRYFKQQEITLYRVQEMDEVPLSAVLQAPQLQQPE